MPGKSITTGVGASEVPLPAGSWIQKTPGVCGGDACIRNTRITVWGLVNYRRLGLTDARILEVIDGLTQADLDAAWDYEIRNRAEIEQAIQENEEA
jgi:uncharacterized protein (DUF433 family)